MIHCSREQWPEAWAGFLSLAKTSADHEIVAASLNNMGLILEKQNCDRADDDALACYQEAIRYCRHPIALCNLGHILKNYGRFDDALGSLDEALAMHPACDLIQFRLGLALLMFGDFEHGWDLYEARLSWRNKECPSSSSKESDQFLSLSAGQPLPDPAQSSTQ